MNHEILKLIAEIGHNLSQGRDRSDIVEQLIDEGLEPQTAQDILALADQWRAGQGHHGYTRWFWGIMKNQAPAARGAIWLWLATSLSIVITLPMAIAVYNALPPGRYPVFLIVLPTLFFGFLLAYAVGLPIFRFTLHRKLDF
ncbi:hypothetical protein [Lysobacter antibioticus]|uniref:hypothetical protein n=1 Tax=Lysobacter antibioticus TaxID=84531 RepID=UPI00126A59AE|nr:hypothetical protein [Lysobacter antibioticus]